MKNNMHFVDIALFDGLLCDFLWISFASFHVWNCFVLSEF